MAPYDSVEIDNVAAARVATEHLLRLGRRRIVFVGTSQDPRDVAAHKRFHGHEQALDAAGIPVDARLVPIANRVFDRANGTVATQRLLAQGLAPDALLCFNDRRRSAR